MIYRSPTDFLQATSTKGKKLYMLSKDRFYKGRKLLKDCTTCDLGFPSESRIFINESLTEGNKELFNASVKTKKELKFLYIWTSNGKIYLRKTQDRPVKPINKKDDLKTEAISKMS